MSARYGGFGVVLRLDAAKERAHAAAVVKATERAALFAEEAAHLHGYALFRAVYDRLRAMGAPPGWRGDDWEVAAGRFAEGATSRAA